MKQTRESSTSPVARRRIALVLCIAGAGWLTACGALDDLLSVQAPSRVEARNLDDPATASLQLAGVIADFECALSNYITAGALLGDELEDGNGNVPDNDIDRRAIDPAQVQVTNVLCGSPNVPGPYRPLAIARYQADAVLKQLDGWTDAQVPNRASAIATAAAYGGYAYLLIGEGWCSATFDLGPELQPAQVLPLAEALFGRAITTAQQAGNTAIQNLALVGRARTRLGLGKGTEAAADAGQVPAAFVLNANYSAVSARNENHVHKATERTVWYNVGPLYRNVTYNGVPDPRFNVVQTTSRMTVGGQFLWAQRKYSALTSPIPIATGDEAQLIVAEVAGGQTAIGIINAFHSRAGIPLFTGTSAAAIRDQIVYERKAELFLESHHLADIRRYNQPLVPAAGTPFPFGSGTYGSDRCFKLPDYERLNNPNF